MLGLTYPATAPAGTLMGSRAASVHDARYADYIAFADARTGLYAVPNGSGGKRQATAAEFWATPGNVSFDSATNGVQDLVLSAQTQFASSVQAVLAAAEATVVVEAYPRAAPDRTFMANASHDLFQTLSGGGNASMWNGSQVRNCAARRGTTTSNRFRGVCAWSASGRTLALNGGGATEDIYQPGARSSPRLSPGRYIFFGVIANRKSAAWIKGNSLPEPVVLIHGDSLAMGDATNTGYWHNALSGLLPGNPAMENLGLGGTSNPTIESTFLAEAADLTAKRMVWGGHNGPGLEDWKVRVANMVASTNGGLSNFALFPVMPSAGDGQLAAKAALHAYFKALYGPHYLGQVLDQIVALGAPGKAYADPVSYAQGVPPAGLRYDALHLNKLCTETIVAPIVRAAWPALGWRL